MITIYNKKDCCGCSACVQRCPKQCINMQEDNEGFLYPNIDIENCINCGLCKQVCPKLNQSESHRPIEVFASKNPDEAIRRHSSSGGIFAVIAEYIIQMHGVVFGAKYDDNWEVIHSFTESKNEISLFRGSKYVQSNVGNTYKEAESFLKQGRMVLYSGTPCQIAGLNHYLNKEYDNLITIDLICHGVPSPAVWRTYLKEDISKKCIGIRIKAIDFRNKKNGWKKFGFAISTTTAQATQNIDTEHINNKNDYSFYEYHQRNAYMRGFLNNIYLRPSCYDCFAKCGKSKSDISLGDYWGVEHYYPEFDDNKGVSAVLINTYKGGIFFSQLNVDKIISEYDNVLRGNPYLERSVSISKYRDPFFNMFAKCGVSAIKSIAKKTKPSLLYLSIVRAKQLIRSLI